MSTNDRSSIAIIDATVISAGIICGYWRYRTISGTAEEVVILINQEYRAGFSKPSAILYRRVDHIHIDPPDDYADCPVIDKNRG